ncbi:TolC family protein, partial [Dyadobacter bucti]|uniref:TolC family protein n=1 Tax=Dyadobacter bucti TaxID=2572203 RepID=UPI003F6E8C1E
PVLYLIFEKRFGKAAVIKPLSLILLVVGACICAPSAKGQDSTGMGRKISLSRAIEEASTKNLEIKSGVYQIDVQKALLGTARDLAKTDISWMGGQYNSRKFDNQFNLNQTLPHPGVTARRRALLSEQVNGIQTRLEVTKNELVRQVKSTYYSLLLVEKQRDLLQQERLR